MEAAPHFNFKDVLRAPAAALSAKQILVMTAAVVGALAVYDVFTYLGLAISGYNLSRAFGVYGFFPVNADGDDLVVWSDDRREHEEGLVRGYHDALLAGGVEDYPFGELWEDYRRAILFCFNYPMTAAGQLDISDERSLALVTSMMDRSVAAITDLDAIELRPG